VILRLCGIYGPGDTDKSTIYAIVSAALREKKIYVYGDGKNLRDYVYVDDLCALIKHAISKKLNITVNVATGKSYSILAIARIVQSSLSIKVDIESNPSPMKNTDERIRNLIFDRSYFKKSFDGLELLDLKDGIPVYLRHIIKK